MSDLNALIEQKRRSRLDAYRIERGDIREHYGIEQTVLAGGYGYRQVLELVQNGADAILEAEAAGEGPDGVRRIHVLLLGDRLYTANTGAPLSAEGVDALLQSHSSPKRANQIGRFGLGFKSLLRLGGRLDVLSTSGSLRFDPDRCRRELREEFRVEEAPGLRLAWPLDTNEERRLDPRLAAFEWAATVVRAEIRVQDQTQVHDHLRQEIEHFPAEFVLFLPVPVTLHLEVHGGGESVPRLLRREDDAEDNGIATTVLHDSSQQRRWRVVTKEVRVDDAAAQEDATHIHGRAHVPVSWAVPLDAGREEAGRFWAFFPTQTPSYLAGILNAPWKLNSDRNAIIGGEWNEALMREAARVVAQHLPSLATADDPGRPLDAFPRQLARQDELAAPLVEEMWTRLEDAEVVADAAGNLREPRAMWRHPRGDPDLAAAWTGLASDETCRQFVHPSCERSERASRLEHLARRLETRAGGNTDAPRLRKAVARDWFAAVATTERDQAIATFRLADSFAAAVPKKEWETIRATLAIVPTEDGRLVVPGEAVVAPSGCEIAGRAVMADFLQQNREACRIAQEVLGVMVLDEAGWRRLLQDDLTSAQQARQDQDNRWRRFWSALRAAPGSVRDSFASANGVRIRVRRRDGHWSPPDEVLIPGRVIGAGETGDANQKFLVDDEENGDDRELLTAIGVSDLPEGSCEPDHSAKPFSEWRSNMRQDFWRSLTSGHRTPHQNHLQPARLAMPRGYGLLTSLTGRPNAVLTLAFVQRLREEGFRGPIRFGHDTRPDAYPKIELNHPLAWWILRNGTVVVGSSSVALAAVIARREQPAIRRIADWDKLEPAIEALATVDFPVLPNPDQLTALWEAIITQEATAQAVAEDGLGKLWSAAARDGVVPKTLPSAEGSIPLKKVFVTSSHDLARRARVPQRIVQTLDDDTCREWLRRGARDLAAILRPGWSGEAGPRDLLASAIPELATVLRAEVRDQARFQAVRDLVLALDGERDPIPCFLREDVLYVDQERLAPLTRDERLRALIDEIGAARWLDCTAEEALRRVGAAEVGRRRRMVAERTTLPERLLRAVGGAEPLRKAVGSLGDRDFLAACQPVELADLVLSQLGPATLSTLRDALDKEGLDPPGRWSTAEAREFVAQIGFPPEFAAASGGRRDAEEFVRGPIPLLPLHDFQEEVLGGLRTVLGRSPGRRRAVVSLPTGAGKTRVTVQAAVDLVLRPERGSRRVLWIAQMDELCEQAVQAFRQVWVNLGAKDTNLRIVRLWGGNPTPALAKENVPVVVVASIQTLNQRMGGSEGDWLASPALVVVDECHHAIAPSYTRLLRRLDAEAPRSGAPPQPEPAIIGLSATPFRTDDEESARLARRFDNRWLPGEQEDLHERCRRQGVLARIDHESLDSPATLLDADLAALDRLEGRWEGIDFENLLERINQHLAGDEARNRLLVECVRNSSERSILFFANSVDHAKEMAARLHLEGIPAAAVSGDTPANARRYFIERFQQGEIRVLCNHTILTTGFDAPQTDMILIARQVFSPVRYMQMVGRGMRGKKNGGTPRCRLVTVLDNLGRFRDKHPYHYCAHYFTDSRV
jgi:superfamily II DNA or RNA helicase